MDPQMQVETHPLRPRVNGQLLQQFHGKQVCLLASVVKAEGGGTAFQVKASDGAPITVRLKSPISEPLMGLVEVYGIGQGRNLILADKFTAFPEHMSSTFDMASYNEAVNIAHTNETNAWIA